MEASEQPDSCNECHIDKRLRKQQLLEYARHHRNNLEHVMQRCLNGLLVEQPADPFVMLLDKVVEHTKSGLCLSHLVCWPCVEDVDCEVVADIRDAKVIVCRARLPHKMVALGLVSNSSGGGTSSAVSSSSFSSIEEAENRTVAEVVGKLSARLQGAFVGAHALDFANLRQCLDKVCGDSLEPDAVALRDALGSMVLEAVGKLMDVAPHEALGAGYRLRDVECAPEMKWREDFRVWQHHWPELLLVVSASGQRKFCVGLTPWAANVRHHLGRGDPSDRASFVKQGERDCGDMPEMLDGEAELLRQSRAIFEDGARQTPDDDEYCPPLNAISIIGRLGFEIASKIVDDDLSEEEKKSAKPEKKGKLDKSDKPVVTLSPTAVDLNVFLQQFRSALQIVVPGYCELQQDFELQPADDENMDRNQLKSSQFHGCIYGVFFVDADATYNQDTCLYVLDGKDRCEKDLIEYFVSLSHAEPLLRLLVNPLSPRAPSYASGMEELRKMLPSRVVLVGEVQVSRGDEVASMRTGHLRDLSLSAVGLAAEHEARPGLFLRKHGVYDFDSSREHLPALASFVDVSLALPELSRRLVLPKMPLPELMSSLCPLEKRLRRVWLHSYERLRASDEKANATLLTQVRFQSALRRLGYHTDIGQLFRFLDRGKRGSIDANDLRILDVFDGVADLAEIEAFRLLVCSKVEGSPLHHSHLSALFTLWQEMQTSGEAKFEEFCRALKRFNIEDTHQALRIFLCLDVHSNGSITAHEFATLHILSSTFQFNRVRKVHNFLVEQFGNLKSAFTHFDKTRQKLLLYEVWVETMGEELRYPDMDDVQSCFLLLDFDGARAIRPEDFYLMAELEEDAYLPKFQALADSICDKHGSLDVAFDDFRLHVPTNAAVPRQAVEDDGSTTVSLANPARVSIKCLQLSDFVAGCRRSGFTGAEHVPRLIFGFLDATHSHSITHEQFCLLAQLDSVGVMTFKAKLLQDEVCCFRDFVALAVGDDGIGTSPWTALHSGMLKLALDDL